jgi:hypothetical protein
MVIKIPAFETLGKVNRYTKSSSKHRPGLHSRYTDSLRAEQSGVRIADGGGRFSAPAQTGPGAHPASYKMGTGSLSRG